MTVVDLESKIVRPELPRQRDPRDPVLTEAVAEALGARVMAAAADAAKQEAAFLELVGEFDACDAVGWWYGLQSTAHWLSWACSISMGTAREHVRVARALRRMPLIRDAFATGELSYSKVREITRVLRHTAEGVTDGPATDRGEAASGAGEEPQAGSPVPNDGASPGFDEAGMLEFARACTASQLARSVSAWQAAKGVSRRRRAKQQVSWVVREDGTVHFTADLAPEEGAALIAAVQAATDANQDPEVQPGDEQPDDRPGNQPDSDRPDSDRPDPESASDRREPFEQKLHRTRVQGLVEIANHYLGSRPEDRSGADRTMVIIEVNADALDPASAKNARQATEAAAERSRGNASNPDDASSSMPDPVSGPERSRGNVSTTAGDPFAAGKCRVRGVAAIEPTDASRAACDATVLGVIIDHNSVPLAVGREHRLVTKAQRRALIIRDKCCQYPGCHRTRHLKAHHRISWLNGGPTDLDNLILLCQWHHTRVHEHQITITPCQHPDCPIPWRFTRPDGTTISPIIAGSDAPCPWEPGRGSFRQHNDQLVADWETEQATLRRQADQLRAAYDHIHDTRDPDANKIFPIGGGEGFNLANCVTALFHITEPLPSPNAA